MNKTGKIIIAQHFYS